MHRPVRCDHFMAIAFLAAGSACSSGSTHGAPSQSETTSGGSSSSATNNGSGGMASSSSAGASRTAQADGGSSQTETGSGTNNAVTGVGGSSTIAGTSSHSAGGTSTTRSTANGGNSAAGGVSSKAGGGTGIGGTSLLGGASANGGVKNAGGAKSTVSVGGSAGGLGGTKAPSSSSTSVSQGSLTSLQIEANPKNVLSCFVSWKTDQAANSAVQFGTDGYQWEITDANLVTDHRVLVIGMHAAQTYQIKAISTNTSGTASGEGTFNTGNLPVSIPVAKVTVNDKTKTQPGWTLMNIQKGDGTATAKSKYPAQAVMYDSEGQPVWYYIDGTSVDRGGAVSVDLTDVGVLIGPTLNDSGTNGEPPREVDFAGNTLWQCSTATCGGTGTLTHHAAKLPNGHYIIQRDVSDSKGTAPTYEELTSDNKLVWSFDYRKFVTQPSGTSGDWCHGNSITVNIERDEVYANCRFIGLVKTTYKSPSFKWILPASFNGKGISGIKFSPSISQFSDTHDPEIHDDGTILFFDNGGYSGVVGEEGNPHGYHSRAVEYKIDEATMTATLVWEFPGTFSADSWYKTDWYLPFWGDADRLANGNVLVTAGVRGATAESRIFEVTKQDGKVVWEFRLPVDYGVYRSDRITPPLVHAIGH